MEPILTEHTLSIADFPQQAQEALQGASKTEAPILFVGKDGRVLGVFFGAQSSLEVKELVEVQQRSHAQKEFIAARQSIQAGFHDATEDELLREAQIAIEEGRTEQHPMSGPDGSAR